MCFYSDTYVDFSANETPTARKAHRCDECGGVIRPGQRYHKESGKCEGYFYVSRTCDPCEAVRKLVHEAELAEGCHWRDSWCPTGELRQSIRDHRNGYGIIELDEECEPAKLLRPEAAHLFPELVK